MPPRTRRAQHGIGKLRTSQQARCIKDMSMIRRSVMAITAVKTAIVHVVPTLIEGSDNPVHVAESGIGDAM